MNPIGRRSNDKSINPPPLIRCIMEHSLRHPLCSHPVPPPPYHVPPPPMPLPVPPVLAAVPVPPLPVPVPPVLDAVHVPVPPVPVLVVYLHPPRLPDIFPTWRGVPLPPLCFPPSYTCIKGTVDSEKVFLTIL